MVKPNLCGFATVESFKKHTAYLVEKDCLHLLKAAADEMAEKYVSLWNTFAELDAIEQTWVKEQEADRADPRPEA